MKNFRQKAIPAVAMLAVASLSLASVTYAWFTTNNKVSASKIDVNITDTAGGIAISSTQNGSYTNSVEYENVFKDKVIKPLSTSGILTTSGAYSFYEGVVDLSDPTKLESASLFTQPAEGSADANKVGYLTFNLYFENQNSAAQDIYFNYDDVKKMFVDSGALPLSTEALRIGFINRGYVSVKPTDAEQTWLGGQKSISAVTGSDVTDYYVECLATDEDPSKVSVGEGENIKYYKKTSDTQAQKGVKYFEYTAPVADPETPASVEEQEGLTVQVLPKTDKMVIVEPNEKAHLTALGLGETKEAYYGIHQGFTSTNKQSIKPTDVLYAASDFPTETYTLIGGKYYYKDSVNGDALYNDEDENHDKLAEHQVGDVKVAASANEYLKEVSTYSVNDVNTDAASNYLFQLPASSYSKIEVVIWLEGQDVDCLTTISDLDLIVKLSFISKAHAEN